MKVSILYPTETTLKEQMFSNPCGELEFLMFPSQNLTGDDRVSNIFWGWQIWFSRSKDPVNNLELTHNERQNCKHWVQICFGWVETTDCCQHSSKGIMGHERVVKNKSESDHDKFHIGFNTCKLQLYCYMFSYRSHANSTHKYCFVLVHLKWSIKRSNTMSSTRLQQLCHYPPSQPTQPNPTPWVA